MRSDPFLDRPFPAGRQCRKCRRRLTHGDMLGIPNTTVFYVKGYKCTCGEKYLLPYRDENRQKKTRSQKTRIQQFEWRSLQVPSRMEDTRNT